jgi:hypothetical protein
MAPFEIKSLEMAIRESYATRLLGLLSSNAELTVSNGVRPEHSKFLLLKVACLAMTHHEPEKMRLCASVMVSKVLDSAEKVEDKSMFRRYISPSYRHLHKFRATSAIIESSVQLLHKFALSCPVIVV